MRFGHANVPIALLSVGLSVGIWFYAKGQTALEAGTEQPFDVRLDTKGLDTENLYVSLPQLIRVTAEGNKEQINKAIDEASAVNDCKPPQRCVIRTPASCGTSVAN